MGFRVRNIFDKRAITPTGERKKPGRERKNSADRWEAFAYTVMSMDVVKGTEDLAFNREFLTSSVERTPTRGFSLRLASARLRTTGTAYPESKLPLQPTGQNRSSLSRRGAHKCVCLVSSCFRLFLPPLFSYSSLSAVSAISPASLLLRPRYSGLINCVYTAVNSYRCLAPANWSPSRVLQLHTTTTTLTTTTTHAARVSPV